MPTPKYNRPCPDIFSVEDGSVGQWRDRGASSARSDPGPLLSMHCSVVAAGSREGSYNQSVHGTNRYCIPLLLGDGLRILHTTRSRADCPARPSSLSPRNWKQVVQAPRGELPGWPHGRMATGAKKIRQTPGPDSFCWSRGSPLVVLQSICSLL
jgi:hypothetical protein